MAHRLTNEMLSGLLLKLGFERLGVAEKNHRIWRHPESGCTLLLPDNKTSEAPRPAELVGIRAHLHLQGHLDEETFDLFVSEGRFPARSSAQQ
jgi:hypothetical protein